MGIGGDGTIKKGKNKSKASGDASSKLPKSSKNQKAKKRGKGRKTRSRSKTKKSSPSSRAHSGEEPTTEELRNKEGDETDAACMIKPEKLHQTCATSWSEPIPCCVDFLDKATITTPPCGNVKCRNVCLNLVKKEVGNEMEDIQAQAKLCIERVSNERDYYRAEFERLLTFFEKIGGTNEDEDSNVLCCIACQKKDQMVEYLQRENEVLVKEKFCLMSRLEEGGTRFDLESPTGKCCKTSCKRIERERDLLKLDIRRLEEETDCLREKIKTVNENKIRDYAKFQEQRIEYENTINKLEGERRELMKGQGIRRVNINSLEEKVDMYSNLLRVAQEEVKRVKMQYCQLKKLHEQCDKALLDTQAQLMEVEIELNRQNTKDPNRNKKYSKEGSVTAPKCECSDETSEAERSASEEVERTIHQQLDNDKDNLLNQLDEKTELLFKCQEYVKSKVETILKLEEELKNLKQEVSVSEEEVKFYKEKYDESTRIIHEKKIEIKKLQIEDEQKEMNMKNCRTNLEEMEAKNKILQAEVEHLNKETYALATSNHQLQSETQQSQVQISVAMETVNELENRAKQLEDLVAEYESKIRLMKIDFEDCHIAINRKEMEIKDLIENKNNLQKLGEQLNMENRSLEKTICDLRCECQRLKTNSRTLDSKEKMISDLSSEMGDLKAEKDALEKANYNLSRRVSKLENKLFQCICTICDNAPEKCSMANCIFKGSGSQGGTMFPETREKGIQAFCEKQFRTSTNSVKQFMAAVPLKDVESSKAITSTTILPGALDKSSLCEKDAVISSMYQSLDCTSPFIYKYSSEVENDTRKTFPLSFIAEERKTSRFKDNDEKMHDLEKCSFSVNPDIQERQKYIIDNVTSICKVIQVDTEQRVLRRTILDGTASKGSSRSSSGSSKNL